MTRAGSKFSARALAALAGPAAFALGLAAQPAAADDAADCDAGISMIRDELGKATSDKTKKALSTALRVAEREKGEKEYDECLDAVGDARKALGR